MKRNATVAYGTMALLGLLSARTPAEAGGGWSVGVQLGAPYYYRPYGPYYPYYYRPVYYAPPPAYYVAPPPIVVQPAPLVQTAPVVQPAYQTPILTPAVTSNAPPQDTMPAEIDHRLQLLADPNEQVRIDSVMYLGRMKAYRAIDPLAATLAGDRSPAVREAAARALALIGSPKGLTALQQAGMADSDREVRRSAQFAVELIQSGR